MVKADEMIHVCMADKYMAYFKDIPCGEGMEITNIEKNRPVLIRKGDEQGRVAKGSVDCSGIKRGTHYDGRKVTTCLLIQL